MGTPTTVARIKTALDAYNRVRHKLLTGIFQEYAPITSVVDSEPTATAVTAVTAAEASPVATPAVFPVLSAWVVDGKCRGFIMRDGGHPITYDEKSATVFVLKEGESL